MYVPFEWNINVTSLFLDSSEVPDGLWYAISGMWPCYVMYADLWLYFTAVGGPYTASSYITVSTCCLYEICTVYVYVKNSIITFVSYDIFMISHAVMYCYIDATYQSKNWYEPAMMTL